jgi:K+/H+ antiporter YhaU regulatory subunit KhtT
VQTEDFIVPFAPTALNRSLQALGLRTWTGASIIAIYRDPEQIVIPQSDTVLLPGDVLALLGDQEQLAAALRFLSGLAAQPLGAPTTPPQVAAVVVPADSPFINHTLAELGLRDQLGVLVIGVRRGDEQVTNPGPDFRVQAGDQLYVWGSAEQIAQARHQAGDSAESANA